MEIISLLNLYQKYTQQMITSVELGMVIMPSCGRSRGVGGAGAKGGSRVGSAWVELTNGANLPG